MQAAMMHPHRSHRHADATLEIANLSVLGQKLLLQPDDGGLLRLDSGRNVSFAHNVKGPSGCVWERLNPKRAPAAIAPVPEALECLVRKLQAKIAGLQVGLGEGCGTGRGHRGTTRVLTVVQLAMEGAHEIRILVPLRWEMAKTGFPLKFGGVANDAYWWRCISRHDYFNKGWI
jgi:hypothetical protein